ncbi:hypothetical protein V6N13_027451 [Hibiscus sabdariffa]
MSGRSLSDSDLTARWDVLTREVRKALELGKTIGLQIVGDDEEKKSAAPEGDNKSTTRVAPHVGWCSSIAGGPCKVALLTGGGWAGSNVGGAGKRKFHESGAAELEAIREALKIFVAADSFGGRALVVESSSRVVVNICQILADINSVKLQIKQISFVARSSSSSESAAWLEKDGATRRETFRACW